MSYKTLEIWMLANELVIEIHEMAMNLPKFEMYEEGSQIRKSSKNVKASIAEGYGRKIYKAEYLKFLIYALGSTDETRIIWKHYIIQNPFKITLYTTDFTKRPRH
jgi:four helix bundle protein